MKKRFRLSAFGLVLALPFAAMALMACPIRTEHKIETTHKIEAHIVIDLRQIAVEAEAIEEDVRDTVPKAEPDGEPSAMVVHRERSARLVAAAKGFLRLFDVSTTAYAATTEADAKASRKARSGKVNSALSLGCLGENAGGYLESRHCDSPGSEHKALIDAENADRKVIYAAIAVRGGHTANEADAYGAAYAAGIRKVLKKGQWFQVPTADQHYAEFLKTDQAKKLGNPGKSAWVQAP